MDPVPPFEPPPTASRNVPGLVSFRHPAYPPTERDLLRFSPVDGPARDGVDYDFALISCGIVTGNTWPQGWITIKGDDDGQFSTVEQPEDGILREEEYYYFAGNQDPGHKYPIIPSFHHWRFPHGVLPNLWAQLTISPSPELSATKKDQAVLARDTSCRITGHKAAREVAHLVPSAEGHWFNSNKMRRYCLDQVDKQPIDDTTDRLLLRRDLHSLFDQRRFLLVVKRDRLSRPRLLVHVMGQQSADELVELYHNCLTQPLSGLSVELIFARFAWPIFTSQAFPLFDCLAKMAVRLLDTSTGETHNPHLSQQEILRNVKLFAIHHRSYSPTTRDLSQSAQDEAGGAWGASIFAQDGWYSDGASTSDEDASISSNEDFPQRGRARKRR